MLKYYYLHQNFYFLIDNFLRVIIEHVIIVIKITTISKCFAYVGILSIKQLLFLLLLYIASVVFIVLSIV